MSSTLKVPNDKTLLFVSPNEYIIDGQPGIAQPNRNEWSKTRS